MIHASTEAEKSLIYIFFLLENRKTMTNKWKSLLATASRLFAIAWGFTSGFSSQLFMRIFIRALLLNQTHYYGELNVKQRNLYGFFISLT